MINLNPSRKMAARPRAGCFLALFRLFGMPAVLIPALLMLVLADGATALAQVVTNSADSGPGTLRSAITNAASGAVITFDPNLSGATITLSNMLTINTNLTIDASALPRRHSNQRQWLRSNLQRGLQYLCFSELAYHHQWYFRCPQRGGIYNSGTVTLNECTLSGNNAYSGGGIYNSGTVTLNQCTLSENSADGGAGGGGGICNGGTATLNQCTLSGNGAGGRGRAFSTMAR